MNENTAILYVEDDERSRNIMRLLLENMMGLTHVNIFEDSNNFVERVDALQPQPDVVLLDIHVPPHDGFEMLKLLRARPAFSTISIIALTASVMSEEIQQLKSAGFDGVIAKPIDMETFPDLLDRVMNGEHVWHIIA